MRGPERRFPRQAPAPRGTLRRCASADLEASALRVWSSLPAIQPGELGVLNCSWLAVLAAHAWKARDKRTAVEPSAMAPPARKSMYAAATTVLIIAREPLVQTRSGS